MHQGNGDTNTLQAGDQSSSISISISAPNSTKTCFHLCQFTFLLLAVKNDNLNIVLKQLIKITIINFILYFLSVYG